MQEKIKQGERFLAALDLDWARAISQIGPCDYRPEGGQDIHEALIRAVSAQQISGHAARTILARMGALFPEHFFPTPQQIVSLGFEGLRSCGYSANKARTILEICEGVLDGFVPSYQSALKLDDKILIAMLSRLKGVGRWTVEMLLIDCLGRLDVWPVDDLGIRQGYQRLKGLAEVPKAKDLRVIGVELAPYRTIAAWYLWRLPH